MSFDGRHQYDGTILNFINKRNGAFILVSEDTSFCKLFKSALKHLDTKLERVFHASEIGTANKLIANTLKNFDCIVLVIEAILNGKTTIQFFSQLKEEYDGRIKIICTTSEASKEKLIFISDKGADNIIMKPVNMNNIVQKTALTIQPNTKISKLVDATRQMIAGERLAEADQLVDMIFAEKQDSTIGHMLRGDIARLRKDYATAEQSYLVARSQSKLYIDPLKKLVELYSETNVLDKKLEFLKQLDRLSPLNHDRKLELGATCMDVGDTGQAQGYFSEAVRLVKRHNDTLMSSTLMDIGRIMQDKDPAGALEYMAKAIACKEDYLSEDDIWMFNEIGINFRKTGQPEKAIEYYRKALKVAKSDGSIYYNIGMAYAEMKKYYDAVNHFNKAIDLSPSILKHGPVISYNLGVVYQLAGENAKAIDFFNICLTHEPNFRDARSRIRELQKG